MFKGTGVRLRGQGLASSTSSWVYTILMIRRCLFIISLLVVVASYPVQVQADQTTDVLQAAGVEIAIEPSQASASALLQLPSVYAVPGSLVYWFKGVIEQVQYILASSPESRAELLLDFSQQRLAEGYQAIQGGDPQAAIEALTKYQQQQQELSGYLQLLESDQVEMQPYLDKLKQQLGIQKALEDYVEQQLDQPEVRNRVTSLLQIQSNQVLAFKQAEERAVLGQKNQRPNQSSASATPSATPRD